MDRIIEVKVYGNHLTKDSNNAGTRGEANATKLRITFDKSWDNFAKMFIFWDAYGQNPVSVLGSVTLMEGTTNVYLVPIPQEAMARAGELTFTIRGEGADSRQVSITGKLEVEDSPEVLEALPPTSTQLSQMQRQFDEIAGNLMKVNKAIDEDIHEAMSEIAKTKEETLKAEANAVEQANYAAESAKTASDALFYSGENATRTAGLADYAEQCAERAAEFADYAEQCADRAVTITCEAEGESIHISDSAALPMKGLRVLGKTKQLKSTGRNLIPFPYYDGARKELNGLTFTQNYDGGVTINGTATAKTVYTLMSDYPFNSNFVPAGTYAISAGSYLASANTFMVQAKIDYNHKANYVYFQDMGTAMKTTTIPDGVTDAHITIVNLVVYEGYTAENITIYPMLEKGTTPTGYEPYTNGIPSPSPELPQPMNSAGKDGSIDVEISNEDGSDSQALSVSTPNRLPLRGVPVYPDVNYKLPEDVFTDADGNNWMRDEIDFDRGVYIKRVEEYEVNIDTFDSDANVAICYPPFELSEFNGGLWERGMCVRGSIVNDVFAAGCLDEDGKETVPFVFITSLDEEMHPRLTLEMCKERYNGSKMLLILKEPIEKPLPAETLAEYDQLSTYKPVTTISNDSGAHMEVKYIADTKTYIDNKFAELQTAMLNNI